MLARQSERNERTLRLSSRPVLAWSRRWIASRIARTISGGVFVFDLKKFMARLAVDEGRATIGGRRRWRARCKSEE